MILFSQTCKKLSDVGRSITNVSCGRRQNVSEKSWHVWHQTTLAKNKTKPVTETRFKLSPPHLHGLWDHFLYVSPLDGFRYRRGAPHKLHLFMNLSRTHFFFVNSGDLIFIEIDERPWVPEYQTDGNCIIIMLFTPLTSTIPGSQNTAET